MEEENPALFILGWTPRGLATASATALLGPRPDSSMLWRRALSSLSAFGAAPARRNSGRHHRPSGVGAIFYT
jgi:hypothetical protein